MLKLLKPAVGLPAILSLFILTMTCATARQAQVQLGIDVLEAGGFQPLQGKRVGLLTHPAGVNNRGRSTIDVLRDSPMVNLVALYGPEHGIDGKAKADVYVPSGTDPRTGLPVYSLYGPTRKPTPEMLEPIDIMVVDLQDIGVRSYTYVSCLRLTMEACFENNIPVVVLDRPNPLGGLKVDGPPLDKHLMSYVGAYRVPYVHGLTIGELANMAKRIPGWLQVDEEVRRKGQLIIVPMRGWSRDMMWPDTGLRWVPTSPAIPDIAAAMGYALTGLGAQLGGFRHGYGTPYPFRLLTYPGMDADTLAAQLRLQSINGLQFRPIRYQDSAGRPREGVYVLVTDWESLRPTELSFHMMRLAAHWSEDGNPFANASTAQQRLFNIHVGSQPWWVEISTRGKQARVEQFVSEWTERARIFQDMSRQYWLYQ